MNSRSTLLIAILTSCLASATMGDTGYPVGRAPLDIEYRLNFQEAANRVRFDLWPAFGPFDYSTFERSRGDRPLSPAMSLIRPVDDTKIRFFSISGERYRSVRNAGSNDYPLLIGGARYQPSSRVGALLLFHMDREKALDPDYGGKKWRGLAGDVETAIIDYRSGNFGITMGRQRLFWGPQPVNLAISETAEPMDLISVKYRKGRVSFAFLFARLDGSRPDSIDLINYPDRSFADNRYLVGHRLDIKLHRRFRIGFFETMLYGGEGRPPELYYLNPLQFFHTAQLNEDINDNTMLGLDFMYLPGRGVSLYGQLLIDDFQIDNRAQGDQEPNEIGIMAGLFKAGQVGTLSPDIKAEYVRITNRTYHQGDPRNRYLFRNKLIGHPLGPDADSISLSIRFWPSRLQFAEIEIAHTRHGEGSIYAPWDRPWEEVSGDYHEPFPAGVVEKSSSVAMRMGGYLPFTAYTADHFYFNLHGLYGKHSNRGNVAGAKVTTATIEVSLSWIGAIEFDLGSE